MWLLECRDLAKGRRVQGGRAFIKRMIAAAQRGAVSWLFLSKRNDGIVCVDASQGPNLCLHVVSFRFSLARMETINSVWEIKVDIKY